MLIIIITNNGGRTSDFRDSNHKTCENPKRVAAGKLVAEKARQDREAQKKAAAEAAVIIFVNAKKASASADTPPAAQQAQKPTEAASGLSSTRWLAIGGFVISLIGLYYKREDVKAAFASRPHAVTPESVEPSKNNNKRQPFYGLNINIRSKIIMAKVDSAGAIFGTGLICFNFNNQKVFTTVRHLLAASFTDEECEPADLNT